MKKTQREIIENLEVELNVEVTVANETVVIYNKETFEKSRLEFINVGNVYEKRMQFIIDSLETLKLLMLKEQL